MENGSVQRSVHDLAAQLRAELLAELFQHSSMKAKLVADTTARAALTDCDFLCHTSGRERMGAIPFVDAEHVRWACIDLDVKNWGYADDLDHPEVFEIINDIIERLALRGIRAALERSRSKGWHVWMFFDGPAKAADLRALLVPIALEAGAHDGADLVCPRQDRLDGDENVGNGAYLPLFGGDQGAHTKFYECDPDTMDWLVAENQAAVLRSLIENPNPASKVPPRSLEKNRTEDHEDHPCDWIVEELREFGVELNGVDYGRDKIQFPCPIHIAGKTRARGGSAVMWSDGRGHCSSAKCQRKWRTIAQLLDMLGLKQAARSPIVWTRASEIEPDSIEWIWRGRIAAGKITVDDGDPGVGKSTRGIDIAARLSTGARMPDGSPGMVANSIILTGEDGLADTVVPRLRAAAADLSRIVIVQGIRAAEGEDGGVGAPRGFEIPDDLLQLEDLIREHQAAFVLVDPLMAFLNSDLNAFRDQHMRKALAPVAAIGERTGAAFGIVRHFTKKTDGLAIHRGGGTVGIIGAARVGLFTAPDPADPEHRYILAVSKCNIARKAPSLAYSIEEVPVEVRPGVTQNWSRIRWEGESEFTAEMLAKTQPGAEGEMERAQAWLLKTLTGGPQPSSMLKEQASAAGFSEKTVERARSALSIRSKKEPGSTGQWWVALPGTALPWEDGELRQ